MLFKKYFSSIFMRSVIRKTGRCDVTGEMIREGDWVRGKYEWNEAEFEEEGMVKWSGAHAAFIIHHDLDIFFLGEFQTVEIIDRASSPIADANINYLT